MSRKKQINFYSFSAILAASCLQLYPQAKIIRYGFFEGGFYCDLEKESLQLNKEHLEAIESRMRQLLEANTVSTADMLKDNAVEMFRFKKQNYLQSITSNIPRNIISLLKVERDFFPLEDSYDEIGSACHFTLYDIDSIGEEGRFRIKGIASFQKDTLRSFVKAQRALKKSLHVELGPMKSLFTKELVWLEDGILLKENLQRYLDRYLIKSEYKKVSLPFNKTIEGDQKKLTNISLTKLYQEICRSIHKPNFYGVFNRVYENGSFASLGFFKEKFIEQDLAFSKESLSSLETSLSESLKVYEKLFEDFNLKAHIKIKCSHKLEKNFLNEAKALKEALASSFKDAVIECNCSIEELARVEFTLVDTFFRNISGPSIQIFPLENKELREEKEKKDKGFTFSLLIVRTFFGSIERFIALLLENLEGKLPFWLASEQLRLLPMQKRQEAAAQDLQVELVAKGFRAKIDARPQPVKKRILCAKQEKVPITVVIGDDKEKVEFIEHGGNVKKSNWQPKESLINRLKELASNYEGNRPL